MFSEELEKYEVGYGKLLQSYRHRLVKTDERYTKSGENPAKNQNVQGYALTPHVVVSIVEKNR